MDLGIRGKKAIINGGSAGMGKGSAIALAREGVDLVISSRGKDRLENTCEEIRKETGVKVIGVATDHSTDEGREKIINACPDPDILVGTCTPPMTTPDYEKISPDDWRQTLEVSLLSPISFMKELVFPVSIAFFIIRILSAVGFLNPSCKSLSFVKSESESHSQPKIPTSRDLNAFWKDSSKDLPIAIDSPTDFIAVLNVLDEPLNFSKANLGTFVTT